MDLSKLSTDLQAAVEAVVAADSDRTKAQADLANAEATHAKALTAAQLLRDQFADILNSVVGAAVPRKNISL
jgi:outer membrane protein TolC